MPDTEIETKRPALQLAKALHALMQFSVLYDRTDDLPRELGDAGAVFDLSDHSGNTFRIIVQAN